MTDKAPDPLRKLWRARRYAAVLDALEAGAIPSASMLRQALAPRSLGPDMRSLTQDNRDTFARCLSRIACLLGQSLAQSPALAGQIRDNDSPRMLAGAICSLASHMSPDPLLTPALAAIFAVSPRCARQKILAPEASTDGHSPFFAAPSEKELWMLAPRLPGDAAELLIAQAGHKGQPVHPAVAWRALEGEWKHWRDSRALLAVARVARAPHGAAVQRACTTLALGHLARSSWPPKDPAALGSLALIEHLCAAHADMDAALSAAAIIGSASEAINPRAYQLLIPAPFHRSFRTNDKKDAARAVGFLDWMENCAILAARLGLPDIGNEPLANKRLEEAYLSIAAELALATKVNEERLGAVRGHAFPLGFPSLAEAFDSRKATHAMEQAAGPGSTPARARHHL